MKIYRLKHVPTGLYYVPNRFIRNSAEKYVKSNLSKKGKVYTKRPSVSDKQRIYTHLELNPRNHAEYVLITTLETDWEIEEIK